MAWTQKRGDRYRGMYRDATGKVRSAGTFDRETAALGAATRAENVGTTMTWGEWEPEWWKRRNVAPSTERGDRMNIKTHVLPRWGDVRLDAISRDDLRCGSTSCRRACQPHRWGLLHDRVTVSVSCR